MHDVHGLPNDPLTTREAGAALGVANTTIGYWVQRGWLRPSVAHSAIDQHTGLWRIMRFTAEVLRRFVLVRIMAGYWGTGRRGGGPPIPLDLWGDAGGLRDHLRRLAADPAFKRQLLDAVGLAEDLPSDAEVVDRLVAAFAPEAEAAIAQAFAILA